MDATGNFESLGEFLRKLRKDKELTLEEFFKKSGIGVSTANAWERNVSIPRGEGRGKLFKFHGFTDEQRKLYEKLEAEAMRNSSSNVRPAPIVRGLRLVPVVASMRAGFLDDIAANYEDIAAQIDEKIETNVQDENSFALIVEGDSMEPDYRPGDRIILAPNYEPRNGDPVCARIEKDGKTVFKIYRQNGDTIKLESLNPEYKPEDFHKSAFRWIYPAVDLKRKLRR